MSDLTPLSGVAGYAEMGPEQFEQFIETDYEHRLSALFDAPPDEREESFVVLAGLEKAIPTSVDWTLISPDHFQVGGNHPTREAALAQAAQVFQGRVADVSLNDPEVHVARITTGGGASVINGYTAHNLLDL